MRRMKQKTLATTVGAFGLFAATYQAGAGYSQPTSRQQSDNVYYTATGGQFRVQTRDVVQEDTDNSPANK